MSLAKIPGGLFASLFLKLFPNRHVFLGSAVLIIASYIVMGLTAVYDLPSVLAMLAVAAMQFAHSAGYVSVAGLLLGVLLPSGTHARLRLFGISVICILL